MTQLLIGLVYEGDPQSAPLLKEHFGASLVPLPNCPVSVLEESGCNVWVAGGASYAKAFKQAGLLPPGKLRALKWYRGQYFDPEQYPGVKVAVVPNPDTVRYDSQTFSEVVTDMALLRRGTQYGAWSAKLGFYGWARSFEHVLAYLDRCVAAGRRAEISVDLETEGLNPFDPSKRILTVSASARPGISDVIDLRTLTKSEYDVVVAQIKRLVTDPRYYLVGANLKFDMLWIRVKMGIICKTPDFDTCQAGSLLNENRSNSLTVHTVEYAPELGGYDLPFNRTHDKSRMDLVPPDDLLPYAGGDTDAALRVYRAQRRELMAASSTPTGGVARRSMASLFTHIVRPTQSLVHDMEATGMVVDLPRFHALGQEWETEIRSLRHEALTYLPQSVTKKYDLEKDPDTGRLMAPLSVPALVIDFMFTPAGLNLEPVHRTPKTGKPQITEQHLKLFDDHPDAGPFVKIYSAFTKLAKVHGTYYEGFRKHLRADGRWHASYATHKAGSSDEGGAAGTISGRASAADPAVQTLPSKGALAKPLRDCVIAPEGYGILSRDYSQGELRVTACWAPEQNMLKAYEAGKDLHVLTPCELNGWNYDDVIAKALAEGGKPGWLKDMRRTGKVANFGLIYGLRANGLIHYAKSMFDMDLTLDEATTMRDGFFETYPGLPEWHEREIMTAATQGYVESAFGRRRRLPLINSSDYKIAGHEKNKAINFPIQSCLGDMMWWAMSEVRRRAPWLLPFGQIHDNGLWYYPLDREAEAIAVTGDVMENLPFEAAFGWKPQIKFVSDAEIGPRLGSLEEL